MQVKVFSDYFYVVYKYTVFEGKMLGKRARGRPRC